MSRKKAADRKRASETFVNSVL